MSRLLGLCSSFVVTAIASCTAPQEDAVCPVGLVAGDLVITEVRNTSGERFIEIYNATGQAQELLGLHIRVIGPERPTADPEGPQYEKEVIIVRRSLAVASHDRVALTSLLVAAPPYDYSWSPDLVEGTPSTIPDVNGSLELEACGVLIDRVAWADLPDRYSLGVEPPTADGNDPVTAWCETTTSTPGEANPPCP